MVQHPHQRHRLRQQRGESRAADTPVKYENEYRGKHKVAPHGKHRREHGLLRIARGTHHVVKAYHHIRNWRAEKNHLHKVAGIWQRIIAGTEETEYRVEKQECDSAIKCRIDHTKNHHIAENVLRPLAVALTKAYR